MIAVLKKSLSRRGFSLIELMIVVAIMGVLAAIAIPSLQKSVRRARTIEALLQLRKMFDGSVAYVEKEHTDAIGSVVAPQFPATTTITPGLPPAGVKAEPNQADWTGATWEALTFAITDPYYYVYEYESSGTDDDAQFRAGAFGDLDGDGNLSTFFRGGRIEEGGRVRGFPGVARVWELE